MRITTLDQGVSGKPCGVEILLRRLAASPEPLEAACWHKLLELTERLQSTGPQPELWGHVFQQELTLFQPAPPDPVRARQMKRFIDEWRALNPDPTTGADRLSHEMGRRFPHKPGIRVSIWVDWQDYAPLRDGMPEMHYRFQVKRPGNALTEDVRAKDLGEAEGVILDAFGL